MKTRQCVILAGGLGSRLGKISKKIPKPLLKINKFPFLFYLILKLKKEGISKILILTWHKSEEFFKINFYKKFGIDIKILKEKKKLGTGGSIINSYKFLDKKFFLVNGDTFFNINLKEFRLRKKFNVMTACYNSNIHKNKYGYFFNKKNRLVDYKLSNEKKFWVSGGIYIVKKKIFKTSKVKNLDLDKNILKTQHLHKKLTAKKYYNEFIDIGTIFDLKKAKTYIPTILKKNNYIMKNLKKII